MAITLALAGRVLISWMRKVSGLTMMTSGMPVVCCTQHTKPGWFMTSDHWHRAGDILLLPPLELKQYRYIDIAIQLSILLSRPSEDNIWCT